MRRLLQTGLVVHPAADPRYLSPLVSIVQSGSFVNATSNYYSAPANTNAAGVLVGHSHVVIEAIDSLTTTQPTDPTKFAFFKVSLSRILALSERKY